MEEDPSLCWDWDLENWAVVKSGSHWRFLETTQGEELTGALKGKDFLE